MNGSITVFDEVTNTNKEIKFKNVTSVEASPDIECVAITHDNGDKKKFIPAMLVREINMEDIKSTSLM